MLNESFLFVLLRIKAKVKILICRYRYRGEVEDKSVKSCKRENRDIWLE